MGIKIDLIHAVPSLNNQRVLTLKKIKWINNENEIEVKRKAEQMSGLYQRIKKVVECNGDSDTNRRQRTWISI